MQRFIVPAAISSGKVEITGAEANHLYRVLRLHPGDIIEVFDGQGQAYLAKLVDTSPLTSTAEILQPVPGGREPEVQFILAQALVKGEKMDWIIQKGTELGVHTFVPFCCERTVVKLTGEKTFKRRERWQRIAQEAAKQCGRPVVPKVEPVVKLAEVLAKYNSHGIGLLPWEGEYKRGIKAVLQENVHKLNSLLVIIGPEGGFTQDEVESAQSNGIQVVSLGPRILRAETAALATVTMALYEFGELGG
ncbi:MAG: 16S rRNA (uracil(1498)-N(3))-methyltransferase [bacterium]|jgi:16S rRNA (uracil1498-N3)-methyltransferase